MQMTSIPYDNRKPSAIKVTFIQKSQFLKDHFWKAMTSQQLIHHLRPYSWGSLASLWDGKGDLFILIDRNADIVSLDIALR